MSRAPCTHRSLPLPTRLVAPGRGARARHDTLGDCFSASPGDERKAYSSRAPRARRKWPLARRLVALARKHRDVERRIVRPGPEHAVIEVQAVHLGADDVVVHLLGDRPAAWIDRREACLITRERFCCPAIALAV